MEPTAPPQNFGHQYINDAHHRVSNLVGRLTYKPGFKIAVIPLAYPYDGICIRFSVGAEGQPGDTSEPIEIHSYLWVAWQVAECIDEWALAQRIFNGVLDLERHQAQGWFKLDGVLFDDPHQRGPSLYGGLIAGGLTPRLV